MKLFWSLEVMLFISLIKQYDQLQLLKELRLADFKMSLTVELAQILCTKQTYLKQPYLSLRF